MSDVNNAIASETKEAQITPKFEVGQVWVNNRGCFSWFIFSEDEDFIYGRQIHFSDRDIYRWGKKDGKFYGRVGHFEANNRDQKRNLTKLLGYLSDMLSPLYPHQGFKVGKQYKTEGNETVTIVSDRYNHGDHITYLGLINRPHGQISVLYCTYGLEWNGDKSLDISFK